MGWSRWLVVVATTLFYALAAVALPGSAVSVTDAENCAESATTLAPQIAATINSRAGGPP